MALKLPVKVSELSVLCGTNVVGDPDVMVSSVAAISHARAGALSFLADRKHIKPGLSLSGSVIITRPDLVDQSLAATFLIAENPREIFFRLLREFDTRPRVLGHVHERAVVDSTSLLGENVVVGCDVHVGKRTVVGNGTILHATALIGDDVKIGRHCEIHPRVVIMDRVVIGDYVTVFPGTVIGSDGFGFIPDGSDHINVPQMGTVIIEDRVRIGANCTIDRATLGETRIGRGTKIDNLVHIAHNCIIGKNCLLCAQVGLGGSTILEDNVVLGGQVGLGDHVVVGEGARMGGQSGSSTNVKGGETYFLTPALPIQEVYRVVKSIRRLPTLFERVRRIERLREEKDGD